VQYTNRKWYYGYREENVNEDQLGKDNTRPVKMPVWGRPPEMRKEVKAIQAEKNVPVVTIKDTSNEVSVNEVRQERDDKQTEIDRQRALENAEVPIHIQQRTQEGVISRALKLMGEDTPTDRRTLILEERGKYQLISNQQLGVSRVWIDTTTGKPSTVPDDLPGFLLK
jgi:hypothetical protein